MPSPDRFIHLSGQTLFDPPLVLPGKWEVALSSMIYTIRDPPERAVIEYWRKTKDHFTKRVTVVIPPFSKSEDVVSTLMANRPWSGIWMCKLDKDGKFNLAFDSEQSSHFRLNPLARRLFHNAPATVGRNTTRGIPLHTEVLHTCKEHFIEADFIHPQIVGGTQEKVLRIVPFQHEHAHQRFNYEPIHYDWCQVNGHRFTSLPIFIRESTHDCTELARVSLEGDVSLTLVFRQA